MTFECATLMTHKFMTNKYLRCFLLIYFIPLPLLAIDLFKQKVSLQGSIQSDILFPEEDNAINSGSYSDKILTNTYLSLNLQSQYVNAGGRLEYLSHPLPGFEKDFAGWGVPYFYVTGKFKNIALTLGDFYEQFGSGFIFRTYEERSLGIDNSIRGAHLAVDCFSGVRLRILGGKQRRYWEHNDSYVWGSDLELNLDQWIASLRDRNAYLLLGGSYVGKYEKDQIIPVLIDGQQKQLNLPLHLSAFDVRAKFQKENYSILAEYAYKINDPSADNGYIYKNGNAFLLSGSYSQRGMSILLQAKRSDNMSFRSKREMQGTSSFINHLPAFSMQHAYSLATLYPYSTQPEGEWAFQGEAGYTFKRKTPLGGKYGTFLKLHFAHIRAINKKLVDNEEIKGTDGYSSSFFKMGKELYYQDLNLTIEKKISKTVKLNGMYIYQRYNPAVIVKKGEDIINSHIFVAEGRFNLSQKLTLRSELQYLLTSKYTGKTTDILERSNQGDWIYGMVELSVLPYLMFSVSDMYNNGGSKLHYYMTNVVGNYKANRLQVGYGRTRAGYNCSGGVCRMVPASRGFQVSYSYNF